MKNKKILLIICAIAAAILAAGIFFALGEDKGESEPIPSLSEAAEVSALPEPTESVSAESSPLSTPAVQSTAVPTAEIQLPQETELADLPTDNNAVLRCSMSISCATILNNADKLDPAKSKIVPSDGVIYAEKSFEFSEGETVFDVLLRETRANKIHMEYSKTPAYDSAYIEGIGNLYEFDCGALSGWLYKVNGEFPGYSCSRYTLKNGDKIEFLYTCDLGRDIGAEGVKQR